MPATHDARAKNHSPLWLLFMTVIGGIALGYSGGPPSEPAATTPADHPRESAFSDADDGSPDNEMSRDAARYQRLNSPYYGFLGIDAVDTRTRGIRARLPQDKMRRSVAWIEFLIVTLADPIDTH